MPDLTCFAPASAEARTAHVVAARGWTDWLTMQPPATREWLEASAFTGKAGSAALLPGAEDATRAVLVTSEPVQPWDGRGGQPGCDPARGGRDDVRGEGGAEVARAGGGGLIPGCRARFCSVVGPTRTVHRRKPVEDRASDIL